MRRASKGALCLVAVAACSRGDASATAPLHHASDAEMIRAVGYTEPSSELRRLVFARDGVIAKALKQRGERARAGEPLMELRSDVERTQLDVAESELQLAAAQRLHAAAGSSRFAVRAVEERVAALTEAERQQAREYARASALVDAGALSATEVERTESVLTQARASREAAAAELDRLVNIVTPEERGELRARVSVVQARVREAETRLAETVLRAPTDGVVLDVLRREGEAARTLDGQPVILFADDSSLRVRAEVDERFIGRLHEGSRAHVAARALGDARLEGTVVSFKRVMGKRSVFARTSDERRDLDVLETWIAIPSTSKLPFGLEVTVEIEPASQVE